MPPAVVVPNMNEHYLRRAQALNALDKNRKLSENDWAHLDGVAGTLAIEQLGRNGIHPAKMIARAGEIPDSSRRLQRQLAPYKRAAGSGIDYDMKSEDIIAAANENVGELGRLQAMRVRAWRVALSKGKEVHPHDLAASLVAWTNKFEKRGKTEVAETFARLAAPATTRLADANQKARVEVRRQAKDSLEL